MSLYSIIAFIVGFFIGATLLVFAFRHYNKKHQLEWERLNTESDETKLRKQFQQRSQLIKASEDGLRGLRFRVINEISEFRETTNNLTEFSKFTVDLIAARFQLSHAALFYVDSPKEYANMIAGTGEGGRKMVERKHRFELANHSFVAYCITQNAIGFDIFNLPLHGIFYSRISDDINNNEIPPFAFSEQGGFGCPDLPETIQRLVLPLRVSDGIIGVLDIHTSDVDMGRESAELLLPLANHIAQMSNNFER